MTTDKKIDMLRQMMDDETDRGILEVYLELAAQKILNRMYPYKENYEGLEVPDRYVAVQLKIANYMINKIGRKGKSSTLRTASTGITVPRMSRTLCFRKSSPMLRRSGKAVKP